MSAVKVCRAVKPVPSVWTANTVPWPELPPAGAVPYSVLPDKINPARGLAPSLLVELLSAVKLCRFVKPVPAGLTANTVPLPELPPILVVPYRMLPDKINSDGSAPSLLLVKVCRIVKSVPLVVRANTLLPPPLTDTVPYRVLPDKVKPVRG